MSKLTKVKEYIQDYGFTYAMKKIYYRYRMKYQLGGRQFPVKLSKAARSEQEAYKPSRWIKVSIVVPLYNTPKEFLRQMLQSVLWQTYSDWELCLVDASDTGQQEIEATVEEYQQQGVGRIQYHRLSENKGIAENTNVALEMATGDYIGLMDHDDILHPSALYWVVREIEKNHGDFIYTDELSFVGKTSRVQSVHLKPDFGLESLLSNNYICHFVVFKKKLLERAGDFQKEMDGAQDYDLFLRLIQEAEKICHVPKVLYYWRIHQRSSASGVDAKPYIVDAGRRAVTAFLRKKKLPTAVASSGERGPFYQVIYHVPEKSKVCILVSDEERAALLRRQAAKLPYQVMIQVVTGHKKPDISQDCDAVILLRSGYAPSEIYMDWLTELLGCLQPSENMVASAVVREQDGHIYHAGYCYDKLFPEQIRPLYRGVPGKEPGYMNHLLFRQNVSLLGGAVLAIKPNIFREFMSSRTGKGKYAWQSWGIFSDEAWFSICFLAKERQGDCVITPYTSFQRLTERGEDAAEEYKDEGSWQEKHWQEFMEKWEHRLSRPDPHSNPGMLVFGKYYFLWRKGSK